MTFFNEFTIHQMTFLPGNLGLSFQGLSAAALNSLKVVHASWARMIGPDE